MLSMFVVFSVSDALVALQRLNEQQADIFFNSVSRHNFILKIRSSNFP